MEPFKRISVAVAVIINSSNKVLLSKRAEHLHQGGKWEFAGGKVEKGETAEQALLRECKEELAIDIAVCKHLKDIDFDYPDKQVKLIVFEVSSYVGEPVSNEGQEIAWVSLSDLHQYDFPAANKSIVEMIMRL
jgi:8-oxo-dGTP diphosphatase